MLFNEPKLLKYYTDARRAAHNSSFSALQRAEIAEIDRETRDYAVEYRVSVLFNEPKLLKLKIAFERTAGAICGFSALQRAEIAEMSLDGHQELAGHRVSVLFNEPKLLKSSRRISKPRDGLKVSVLFNEPKLLKSPECGGVRPERRCFSALQRAEIAEITRRRRYLAEGGEFQCSSTSRNC